MKPTIAKLIMFTGLGALIGTAPRALADEWDQKTIFTFSGPVEVPGQVLTAGTYVFKLADSQSDRNIVQVYNKDETQLYGTFLTIPDQRLRPAGKAIITFDERPVGSPEAVRAWFYPGELYGHDFVYPKPKAVALAKANKTAVPSMPAELAANTTKPTTALSEPHVVEMRQAPLKAQTATEEDVEIVDVFAAEVPVQPVESAPAATSLPSTASSLPLIAFMGLLSLGIAGGIGLGLVRAHK